MEFLAVKNVSTDQTYSMTYMYGFTPGTCAIITADRAKQLIQDYPDYIQEFGDKGWANEVIKNGTVSENSPYKEPVIEEVTKKEKPVVPASAPVVTPEPAKV